MPRIGELTYYERLGEDGRQHALAKPFTDQECGLYLQRVGALLELLPPPPARILECGCGTGWLAYWLARRGYEVVATDVSPDAIQLAREHPTFVQGQTPVFVVADSESLEFESAFDVVVFFDSLHHSLDERAALRSAYRALRPGGRCIALEPGRGHHARSRHVEAEHDVTEKDMPPAYVWRIGREAGFARYEVWPSPQHLGKTLYANDRVGAGWLRRVLGLAAVRALVALGLIVCRRWYCGITVLHKAGPRK